MPLCFLALFSNLLDSVQSAHPAYAERFAGGLFLFKYRIPTNPLSLDLPCPIRQRADSLFLRLSLGDLVTSQERPLSPQQPRSFKLRLGLLIGAAITATGIFALAVYDSVSTVQIHGPLYVGIVQGKDLIADALPPPLYIVESYLVTLELLIAHPDQQQALISQFQQLEQEFNEKQTAWRERLPRGPLRNTFESSGRWAKEFYDQWNREFLPAVEQGATQTMTGLVYGPLTSRFQQHRREILELVQLADAQRRQIEHDATSVLRERTYLLGLLGLGLIGTIFIVGWLINRHISHPLMQGLRESEERTRSIVNTALDAVIVMDDHGVIIDWNPQAEQIFGWPREAILGEKLSDRIIPPQYREAHEKGLRHYLKTGEGPVLGKRLEITALRRDGVEIAVELAITPLKLATGTTFSAFVRDVSERKRAEDALRVSEARLAMTVQGSNVGIYDWDIDHNTAFFSPEWKGILGYTNDEICHEFYEWESRLHPDDRDDALKTLESYLNGESSHFELEHRLRHKSGDYRWISARGLAQRDEHGKPHRMVGIVLDVTEKKRSEEELRLAKEAAEAASIAKSQFLANMSHEIRTPMNGVIGMTELLLGTSLTARQHHLAETVHRSASGLLDIINDILDFSKIEAGKLQLEQVDFDLYRLCEEVGDLFVEPVQRKGIEYICRIAESVPSQLKGDPVRLRQILVNLLSNAVKFTKRGEIGLLVDLVEIHNGKALLRFHVKDSGIGIPADAQQRIFQAFDQADSSTTRKYGGTGLGLAIVNRLVEMMGGLIGVESAPGEGSTFWFVIRLGIHTLPYTPHETFLAGRRVLIVDDNETDSTIVAHHVQQWGATATCAESGARALELLRHGVATHHPYDAAILDMQMPEMDGLELARIISQDPALQSTLLVMLTSLGEQGAAARAAGIRMSLTKPIAQTRLRATLAKLFEPDAPPTAHSTTAARRSQQSGYVLLAEDNAVNREVALGMLELLGYRVQAVENGRLAVEAATAQQFDLVLMDCQMPEMDGFSATAAIRRFMATQKERSPLPIVALTANAMQGDREACLKAGMNGYLSKPFTLQQLQDVISQWMPAIETPSPSASTASLDNLTSMPAALVSPASSHQTVIDTQAWNSILALQRSGQPDLLDKILGLYLKDSQEMVDKIEEAVTQRNASLLRESAHSLKSRSAMLGALQLAELCKHLEQAGRDGDFRQTGDLLHRLKSTFADTSAMFEQERSKRAA